MGNMNRSVNIAAITNEIRDFIKERDWDNKFKNLSEGSAPNKEHAGNNQVTLRQIVTALTAPAVIQPALMPATLT